MINFPSSPTILIGDSPPTLWPRSTEVTNVFPWKQTCHAIVTTGLSNETQLCQRGTSWWPDWSRVSTTVWLLTTKLPLNCVWALAVIVRHVCATVPFGLFVSQPLFSSFVSVYLSSHISLFLPPLLWFVFYKGSAHLSLMTPAGWNTAALRGEKKFFYPIRSGNYFAHIAQKAQKVPKWSEGSGARLWHTDKSFTLLELSDPAGKKK